ncbi:type IV secretion system protein VirJ [Pandoraea terrae]|uniref:Type IV secretion system protein VirJ n=1 Tax=Pandoraea terrae TaxID=1537710 RepID=A0A5E4YA77_9BURK|nr:AcvB/VirJ family lysyl-phosphatidylglycerol hydrolase [Pandoraea terrae]VVE45205.1 type IV secretion system protein VirJ [Pandoraea terrae]
MKRAAWLVGLGVMFGAGAAMAAPELVSHGRFENVPVFHPQGEPNGTVLFLSDAGGWTPRAERMARALTETGALVAGIDTARLMGNFDSDPGKCVFPSGDLDNFGRFLEAYEKLSAYTPPLLVGDGVGGTLAYAMLAQAPAETFSGALSVDFCPVLQMKKPLCQGENVYFQRGVPGAGVSLLPAPALPAPWLVMSGPAGRPGGHPMSCTDRAAQSFSARVAGASWVVGGLAGGLTGTALEDSVPASPVLADWITQYKNAFQRLNAHHPPGTAKPPAAVSDLPVIEIPASGAAPADMADTFAILWSGDGGWAGLDREVAGALSARGVPVVGVDSLRYFWSARTPASGGLDLDRLIRFYEARWRKRRVLLIGYSQGADVLPFMINRVPAATRQHIALAVLMGLGQKADFEFRMTNWVMSSQNGLPIRPEVERLPAGLAMCVYGVEETDSNCPSLDPKRAKIVKLPGGHHFDGDYRKLAQLILDGVKGR